MARWICPNSSRLLSRAFGQFFCLFVSGQDFQSSTIAESDLRRVAQTLGCDIVKDDTYKRMIHLLDTPGTSADGRVNLMEFEQLVLMTPGSVGRVSSGHELNQSKSPERKQKTNTRVFSWDSAVVSAALGDAFVREMSSGSGAVIHGTLDRSSGAVSDAAFWGPQVHSGLGTCCETSASGQGIDSSAGIGGGLHAGGDQNDDCPLEPQQEPVEVEGIGSENVGRNDVASVCSQGAGGGTDGHGDLERAAVSEDIGASSVEGNVLSAEASIGDLPAIANTQNIAAGSAEACTESLVPAKGDDETSPLASAKGDITTGDDKGGLPAEVQQAFQSTPSSGAGLGMEVIGCGGTGADDGGSGGSCGSGGCGGGREPYTAEKDDSGDAKAAMDPLVVARHVESTPSAAAGVSEEGAGLGEEGDMAPCEAASPTDAPAAAASAPPTATEEAAHKGSGSGKGAAGRGRGGRRREGPAVGAASAREGQEADVVATESDPHRQMREKMAQRLARQKAVQRPSAGFLDDDGRRAAAAEEAARRSEEEVGAGAGE
mmetsp:Transcript_90779/g.290962  ORF Transcript_90779/g.290962 Transcript_90779/m.290962 type:complete len:544 (-) Transcript_90779:32-1663(-)